jgi:hypothetical protein
MVLYLIVQPVTGDNARGEPDANDDESLVTESAREISFEFIRLNKHIYLFIYKVSVLLEDWCDFSHDNNGIID